MASILIVDDDENVRYLLTCIFADSYSVIEACNGKEGLEAVRQYQLELIITDMQMPLMSGLSMIREIRASNQEIKIIAFGTFFPGKEEELMAAGANLCLQKPVDIEMLKCTVTEMIK
jgi:CheY-like chemotaxis protein